MDTLSQAGKSLPRRIFDGLRGRLGFAAPPPPPAPVPRLSPAPVRRRAPELFAQSVEKDMRGERTPITHWYGDKEGLLYNEDDLVERKSLLVYDRMGVDDQIAASLRIKRLSVLAPGWKIDAASQDPRDLQIRDFVADVLDRMPGGVDSKIEQAMSCMQYGYSTGEKIWEYLSSGPWKGKIGLQNIKSKSPFTFEFITDQCGNIVDDGFRIAQAWGSSTVKIGDRFPRDKFVLWSYNKRFEGPYGQSDLRPCYRSWFSKDLIIKLFNLHIEKFASPTAMAFLPDNLTDAEIQRVQQVLDTIQNLTSATFPEGVEVKYMESRLGGAIAFKFQDAIDMHNKSIARAVLVPDSLGYSGGSTGGSFALGKKQIDVYFLLVLSSLARDIQETIMGEQVIRPLVDYNFPDVMRYPRFRFNQAEDDLGVKAKIFEMLINSGTIDPQADWVKEWLHLPVQALPAPQAAVYTARDHLRQSHGVFLGSTLCHVCLNAVGHDFVADQTCRVAYHSACLDHAGGACAKGGHKDHLLRVQLYGNQHKAKVWSAPRRARAPEPAAEHAARTPTPYEQGTDVPAMRAMLDGLSQQAADAAQPIFTTIRDKLVAWVRRRDLTGNDRLSALDKMRVGTADLESLIYSLGATVAGNCALEAALAFKAKASKSAEMAAVDYADHLLTPAEIRAKFGLKVDTKVGLVAIDFGSFLTEYLRSRAVTIASGEEAWITAGARRIMENAIRQGDPRRAEDDIITMFDAYLHRGGTGKPSRLWSAIDQVTAEAMNEGVRSIYESENVKLHVVAYQWSSILDAKTTKYCRYMDKQVFRPEVMASLFPPCHPHCRSKCYAVYVWDEFTLSDLNPNSPAVGATRAIGFSDTGETVSAILPLRGADADYYSEALGRAQQAVPRMDPSSGPPHITLLYANSVPESAVPVLVESVKGALAYREIDAKIEQVQYMENEDGDGVVYLEAWGDALGQAADELRATAMSYGGQFTHPAFKGHITLGYIPGGADTEEQDAIARVPNRPRLITFPQGSGEVSVKTESGWLRMREERRGRTH